MSNSNPLMGSVSLLCSVAFFTTNGSNSPFLKQEENRQLGKLGLDRKIKLKIILKK
jgi:hypothetical protein